MPVNIKESIKYSPLERSVTHFSKLKTLLYLKNYSEKTLIYLLFPLPS
jgi:hypothetical protein